MLYASMNINSAGLFVPLTSTSQNLNAASKSDIVLLTSQGVTVPPAPRVPGLGKELVLQIAPDFDESLDLPTVNV